jgi:hypothetical protein
VSYAGAEWVCIKVIRETSKGYVFFTLYALWYNISVQVGEPTPENPYGIVLLRPFSLDVMESGHVMQYSRNLPPRDSHINGGVSMIRQWLWDVMKILNRLNK